MAVTRGWPPDRLEDEREAGAAVVVETRDALAERPDVGALLAGFGGTAQRRDHVGQRAADPHFLSGREQQLLTETARSARPAGAAAVNAGTGAPTEAVARSSRMASDATPTVASENSAATAHSTTDPNLTRTASMTPPGNGGWLGRTLRGITTLRTGSAALSRRRRSRARPRASAARAGRL